MQRPRGKLPAPPQTPRLRWGDVGGCVRACKRASRMQVLRAEFLNNERASDPIRKGAANTTCVKAGAVSDLYLYERIHVDTMCVCVDPTSECVRIQTLWMWRTRVCVCVCVKHASKDVQWFMCTRCTRTDVVGDVYSAARRELRRATCVCVRCNSATCVHVCVCVRACCLAC